MTPALRNFAQGDFNSGLSKLRADEKWKDDDPTLDGPFYLGFPGAQGWGEGVLTASLLKRHAVEFRKTIPIFAEPELCSFLHNDPAFRAEPVADFGEARSMGARSPLAILTHALSGNLLDLPFASIGSGAASLHQGRARPLIGIAWASISNGKPIGGKFVPLEKFISVFEDINADIISFQRELDEQDYELLRDRFGDRCSALSPSTLDAPVQTDVMREVRKLDCMVTISTTTAHLAASAGVPVLLLTARRPHQQWFWRAQQEHGKNFYPTVDVLMGGSGEQNWWTTSLGRLRKAIHARLGNTVRSA